MTALTKLIRHSLSYFSGRLAVLLAGLISLPIMARLLPKEDYGVMSLVFLAITITTSFAALGFPQSTTRYFAEYAAKSKKMLADFCSAMMVAAIAAGLVATAVIFAASFVLGQSASFADMAVHLRYASVLILIRLVSSVLLQIYRGNQSTFAFNLINVANRYLTLGLIILLLVYVFHDVTAVFVGTILVEAVIMTIAVVHLAKRRFLHSVRPRTDAIRRAIRFGMPLVIADLMVTLVASSDRFAIQYFLGADSVAVYSVAYDISEAVAILFASPLQLAILPIVYSLWSNEGEEATQAFLNKALSLSTVIVLPMIAGFAVVGPDIVTLLASDKYVESGIIAPYVATGVMLGSVHFLLFAGLLLHERTQVITVLNAIAAGVNLTLNILLIPRFGIMGAAAATIATYIVLNTITFVVSGRHLAIRFDVVLIVKSIAITSAMVLIISGIDSITGAKFADALITAAIGATFYAVAFCAIDAKIRGFAKDLLAKVAGQATASRTN